VDRSERGNSSTVKLVEIPPTSETAALDAGRVQALRSRSRPVGGAQQRKHTRFGRFRLDRAALLQAAYFGTADYINANATRCGASARLSCKERFANAHPDQTLPWLIDLPRSTPPSRSARGANGSANRWIRRWCKSNRRPREAKESTALRRARHDQPRNVEPARLAAKRRFGDDLQRQDLERPPRRCPTLRCSA